jgi:hypothetical protein
MQPLVPAGRRRPRLCVTLAVKEPRCAQDKGSLTTMKEEDLRAVGFS